MKARLRLPNGGTRDEQPALTQVWLRIVRFPYLARLVECVALSPCCSLEIIRFALHPSRPKNGTGTLRVLNGHGCAVAEVTTALERARKVDLVADVVHDNDERHSSVPRRIRFEISFTDTL